MRLRERPRRAGFSMVEALVSSAIVAIAGAALLTSLGAAVQASADALRQTTARGLADALMNEIAAARFPGPTDTRATTWTRVDFDDLDDYDGWTSRPPQDRHGRQLGLYAPSSDDSLGDAVWLPRDESMQADPDALAAYGREVDVETVEPDGTGGWRTSSQETGYRRVTVRVRFVDRAGNAVTILERVRIFGDVAPTP